MNGSPARRQAQDGEVFAEPDIAASVGADARVYGEGEAAAIVELSTSSFQRPHLRTVDCLRKHLLDRSMQPVEPLDAARRRFPLWSRARISAGFAGCAGKSPMLRNPPPLGSDRPARSIFAKRNHHEFRGLAVLDGVAARF